MKLVQIPRDKYDEYRLTAMFDCYKWDPQFLDNNTVATHALVLTQEEYEEVKKLTEMLDAETRAAEIFLNQHLEYTKPLKISRKLKKEIATMKTYDPDKHVRLMRYDFHPTKDGWAVSEVNSDVPGGFAEASLLPNAAKDAIGHTEYWYKNFGETLVQALSEKVRPGGRIMMVHCTCYSDDRQVVQFLGDRLQKQGFSVCYGAADHVNFKDRKAISILDGNEGELDAIVRFTPIEWIEDMRPKRWSGYFDTDATLCNHPISIFAQTKRFPLIWDALEQNGISMATWRSLLPDTIEVKDAKGKNDYIYKPAYGRVGENIGIKEACSKKEYKQIMLEVMLTPWLYLAQKRFESRPLIGADGKEYHVCLGSYSVDGKHAGFYARVSDVPRIDSRAADIPVLIEGSCANDK